MVAKTSYATNQSLLLEPVKFEKNTDLLLKARVLINYVSPVVPVLVANVTSRNLTIFKNTVLANEELVSLQLTNNELINQNLINSVNGTQNSETPVQQALRKADPSLSPDQMSSLGTVLNKYSDIFSANPDDVGRTNVLYHSIDIGDHGPVRQGLRRVQHDQIPVLKAEVGKLQNARMVEPSISLFASPTILVRKRMAHGVCALTIGN